MSPKKSLPHDARSGFKQTALMNQASLAGAVPISRGHAADNFRTLHHMSPGSNAGRTLLPTQTSRPDVIIGTNVGVGYLGAASSSNAPTAPASLLLVTGNSSTTKSPMNQILGAASTAGRALAAPLQRAPGKQVVHSFAEEPNRNSGKKRYELVFPADEFFRKRQRAHIDSDH
jgi:hypothetical protein